MENRESALENMGQANHPLIMGDLMFWKNKKVLITGHNGFKGSWLSLWLSCLGANVTGFSLQSRIESLYTMANVDQYISDSIIGNISDLSSIKSAVNQAKPEIIIHMAAQPLVRESYKSPLETFQVNVMGTANLLEAVRSLDSVQAIVNVTTDKVYSNNEWEWAYRENEPLGGHDPYSSSKGCSELVTAAYRNSFFSVDRYNTHGVAIASARAGNVIGGGDWAEDRLIPDIVRSLASRQKVIIRNPHAIRPWQHVLEPLGGYLLLSRLLCQHGPRFAEAWNFGPNEEDAKPVQWIVERLSNKFNYGPDSYIVEQHPDQPHEATYLKLDCSKAKRHLNWRPKWDLETALDKIVDWTQAYLNNEDLSRVCMAQIMEYENK